MQHDFRLSFPAPCAAAIRRLAYHIRAVGFSRVRVREGCRFIRAVLYNVTQKGGESGQGGYLPKSHKLARASSSAHYSPPVPFPPFLRPLIGVWREWLEGAFLRVLAPFTV